MVPSTAKDGEKLPLIVWLPRLNGETNVTDDWYKKTGIVGAIDNGDLTKFNGYVACIRSDGVDPNHYPVTNLEALTAFFVDNCISY